MSELANDGVRYHREVADAKADLVRHLATAFDACQRHAKTCRECFMPIIDEEGNPGYFGEACKKGHLLLTEYVALESDFFKTAK
jgi:hypothetical protein